jgi:hypothetical protein
MNLPNYILLYDEERDAICSLELLIEHLPKVIIAPQHWKWVVLSAHSALQGFMVLSLRGTNDLNVLSKKSAAKWLKARDSKSSRYEPRKLDDFMNLYSKIKSDAILLHTNSKCLTATKSQDECVQKLNAIRNDFIHYVPTSAAYNMKSWASIILEVIPIIEFLVLQSNNIIFYEDDEKKRIINLCGLAKKEADSLITHYSA